jgi:hypothetical protein
MSFSCLKCDASFISNRDLERHLNRKTPCLTKEEKAKRNDCIGCNKTFYDKSTLNKHKKNCKDIPKSDIVVPLEEFRRLQESVQQENILIRELQESVIALQQENIKIREELNNPQELEGENNNTINGIDVDELSYGFVYIRDNEAYRRDNVYKIGITKSLIERNKYYKTGEYNQSAYIYICKVKLNILSKVDKELKILLKSYNVSNGGGDEFYRRDVLDIMDNKIQELNIEHTIIKT